MSFISFSEDTPIQFWMYFLVSVSAGYFVGRKENTKFEQDERWKRILENVWMLTRHLSKKSKRAQVYFRWIVFELTMFQVCGWFSNNLLSFAWQKSRVCCYVGIWYLTFPLMVFSEWVIWYSNSTVIWEDNKV